MRSITSSTWSGLGRTSCRTLNCSSLSRHRAVAKAALAYTAITQRRPGDGRAHYYLGFCWLNAGQPERALTAFARAAELKQWPAFTPITRQQLSRRSHKKEALNTLEEALKPGFSDNELLRRDTHLDILRNEPRFKALLNS